MALKALKTGMFALDFPTGAVILSNLFFDSAPEGWKS
jgi:hypothetical protein